jgi:hypothetical protein
MHPRFQELSDFIREQRAELRVAVDSVPAHLRDRVPADGRWSVSGVVEHLSIVEGRIAGLLRKKVDEARAKGIGPETESTPILPQLPIERLVDRSKPIKAPHPAIHPTGITTEAGLAALETTRAKIESILAEADGIAAREISHPHVIFGPFNLYEWFAFVGAHEQRHAAQIREIGASFGVEA